MIVSVHQPQYLPWIGYFHKIVHSDIFIFLDDVQYKKREFQNRNKIRTKDGFMWLTVPVITKGRFYQKINEVEIDAISSWRKEHLKSIKFNYQKSKFYDIYISFFEQLYEKDWKYLIDINLEIINFILSTLSIDTKIEFSSKFNLSSTSTQRIIDICKYYNADTYLSGIGGKNYLDEDLFKKNGIKLVYQNFVHPEYPQVYPGFVPYMSIIDLLFNCGTQYSKKILDLS